MTILVFASMEAHIRLVAAAGQDSHKVGTSDTTAGGIENDTVELNKKELFHQYKPQNRV